MAAPRLLRSAAFRAVLWQALVLSAVCAAALWLLGNTLDNLERRSIRSGFAFLGFEAGFSIGETTFLAYSAADSYARAFAVGLLNTLRVAVFGLVIATVIGTVVGVARLSGNWLVMRLAGVYVEVARNVPLLLHLFFWYGMISGVLPTARQALSLAPGVYLSKSGLQYAVPLAHPAHAWMAAALAAAAVACVLYRRWAHRRHAETGRLPPVVLPCAAMLAGAPALAWLLAGVPVAMDVPVMGTFRLTGGAGMTPEFLALLTGLSTYTAGYIAEIVRSGILSVPKGQSEAARALGLTALQTLRFVIGPQALRAIVPPVTSQYLNLVKNSSLAVAIGYPDLVSVGNTALNQTGQAVECIAIMMACYLTISLLISLAMNVYNARIAPPGAPSRDTLTGQTGR